MSKPHEGRSARRRAAQRGWFEYEHREEPVASRRTFANRLLKSIAITAAVLGGSLALGIAGYHWCVGVPKLVDCVYSASMIMGGMGPVDVGVTIDDNGKWFASFYALYSGVVLLASVGLLLTPILHRVMHRLHVETDE